MLLRFPVHQKGRKGYDVKKAFVVLLIGALLFGTMLLWAQESRFHFGKKLFFQVYPPNLSSQWVLIPGEGSKLINPVGGKGIAIYNYVFTPPHVGAIRVLITYKTMAEHGSALAKLTMNYTEKGKENGSAGKESFDLPDSEDWNTIEKVFNLPPGTFSIQVIASIAGNISQLFLKNITVTCLADTIKINDPNADQINQFYVFNTGESAKVQTKVKLTYDENILKVTYICDEPDMRQHKATAIPGAGRDNSAIFDDDCVRLLIFDPVRNYGWQIAANSLGATYDGQLRQAQAGDPYKIKAAWNGEWTTNARKAVNQWEIDFAIPWRTLGFDNIPRTPLRLNFVRERKNAPETSMWNAYVGDYNNVEKFATLTFNGKKGELKRYRKFELQSFIPRRANIEYHRLLNDQPGHYIVGSWHHGIYRSDYPDAMTDKMTDTDFTAWQKHYLQVTAKAGMYGPFLPWSASRLKFFPEYCAVTGVKCPLAISSSDNHRSARKFKAKLIDTNSDYIVDTASPEYLKATLDTIHAFAKKSSDYKRMMGFVHGIDEPANQTLDIFSRSRNVKIATVLDRVDEEIKNTTGFDKYGLPDNYGNLSDRTPFERIAFWRWWNDRFNNYLAVTSAEVKKLLPGLPYMAYNRNNCAGLDSLDVALFTENAEVVSCDPYPTSAAAFGGIGRGIYHTGFSTKLTGDLSPKSILAVTPQGFIYHGRRPEPADVREWASQAIKNGAVWFEWYTEGPANITMYDTFNEILSINKQISSMNRLILPAATKTAIMYSDYDCWALKDSTGHASYSVYAILGEHLKSWFKFVSPTALAKGYYKLSDFKVLYVPRMRYTDKDTVKKMVDFVNGGGILVVFDPDFIRWNIDGTPCAERALFIRAALLPKTAPGSELVYGKEHLPVFRITNLNLPENGNVHAYDFGELPSGTKVLAKYADGKPAIIECKVGKGRVIFSAVMPFGNSDVALNPKGWVGFCGLIASEAAEEIGLPIWDFVLEAKPEYRLEVKHFGK